MLSWIRRIFSRERFRAELQEEIESNIAERAAALVVQGVEPERAAQQARRAFGNTTLARERSVEIWQFRWLHSLWADFKFALYQFRKSPGYLITAILTLALGIGANTAIFTVIDDVMLRSLPVEKPKELIGLGYLTPQDKHISFVQFWPILDYLKPRLQGVADISGWNGSMVTFPDDQNTLRSIGANLVTGNAFQLLGVKPRLGRLLMPSDDIPGGPIGGWPVVLDYDFWRANFHADPAIIGRQLRITGHSAVIVGVLPPDFHGISIDFPQKIYLPLHFFSALAATPSEDPFQHPENFGLVTIARMKPGTTVDMINAQMETLSPFVMHDLLPQRLRNLPAFQNAHLAAESVASGFSEIARQYSRPLLLLQGIVLTVLVLCCVNLGGLQMARLQSRQHEFAVRSALGAGRARILQQCLVESLLLALFGAIFAMIIAWFSVGMIAGFFTPPGSGEALLLRPDVHILLLTAAFTLLTTLLFGMLPALVAGRVSLIPVLKSKGINVRRDLLRQRLFIPAQFALALVLVFTAGLFSHTLLRLRNNHAGFRAEHVLEVCAQFQALKKNPEEIMQLYRSITDAMRASPGIQSAAYTWVTPVTGFAPRVKAHNMASPHNDHAVTFNDVSDGYFATIGTHLLSGREFLPEDRDRSVCIVNQSAVRLLSSGGVPIGDSLKIETVDRGIQFTATCRIVGVVEDAHYSSLRDSAPATVYFPACASTVGAGGYSNNLVFLIQSARPIDAMDAYRNALGRFAPTTGYSVFLPLEDQVDQSIGTERLIAILSNGFACVALLLSGIGLFGVLAIRVHQRMPEMGVRIAIGATRFHIVYLVLREALSMVSIGTLIGVVLILLSSSFTRRFLYETSPMQGTVVTSAFLVLAGVALLATLLPARRAAALNPTEVLRSE